MHRQYDKRRADFAVALQSAELMQVYQDSCRTRYLEILGQMPPKTSLEPVITGVIKSDGYRIEKVIYESFPQHHVTANLYIPEGNGKYPAALLFCGHEAESKATESYQETAILFAKNGFVVLVVDPISQGERYQLTDEKGKALTRGGTTEHTLLNESSNLLGYSTPKDELFDNVRSLDYLESRPEVDKNRIGCLGNSGGGMQTAYFWAFDKRVKVAAPCSYIASRERTLELSGPADGCAQIPGEGFARLEMADYLIMAAPKPLLVLAGRYDFIDYNSTLETCSELQLVYKLMNQDDKLSLFTVDDGHGISKLKREAAVSWFRKWLCNDSIQIKEPGNLAIHKQSELNCTKSGQVATDFPNEINLTKRNRQLYSAYNLQQKVELAAPSKLRNQLVKLLRIDTLDKPVTVEQNGDVLIERNTAKKFILRKEDEVPLPLLAVIPDKPRAVVIVLDDRGKGKLADSAGLISSYAEKSTAVILADLRGMGETADRPEFNDPKYSNADYRNLMLALHVGKPLMGQRVTDIRTILDFLATDNRLKQLPVEIKASGKSAIAALHAAALDKRITNLTITGNSLKSYATIIENPVQKDLYAYVVPGALEYYDLPALVRVTGKRVSFL
nr:acetylxylan esterase [Hufsiella arboris]